MAVCDECGGSIKGEYWEIRRLKQRFFDMHLGEKIYQVCSRPCAEKLMKRLEDRSPVGYGKK